MSETPAPPAPTPAAAAPAAAPAPAAPAAKPAARPAPAKNEASPNAPRPGVVFGGIAGVPDIVATHLHRVQPGDTLESIARDYYGDREKAAKIRAANKDLEGAGALVPGTVVKIPKG